MNTLSIQRILVPSDLAEPSQHALAYAKLFAQCFGAQVTIVYCASRASSVP